MKTKITLLGAIVLLFFATASHSLEIQSESNAVDSEAATFAYSNKWRIKINHSADSDGDIVFRLAKENADPITITVPIKKGTSENAIAKRVKDAFKAHAPKHVRVERDDWEDILVKYRGRISVAVTSNSVAGLKVKLRKE